ncbi:MAG: uroporphyrinogen decarboxylase [Planctomycetota bacterium]|nr:uroporphyrinogen decarboxylase [Planctomycetota bacterium]MDP6762926.1 uroporphyrinogen decarboxylase [Planctomycetota bacterium]MDP6988612.1 uroporphyrinogen decarboxylase [Planctomycetota bacterium]
MSGTNDLLLRALRNEPTARRPLWLMRQAGRCLPEYRALRREVSFEELCATPQLAAEVTLQPVRRFPLDGAIVFADLMSPVAALGIDVRFDPGPIVARPLRDAAAVRALRLPDAAEIAPEVGETLGMVRRSLEGRATLIGFAGAPLSIAAYLVEGRGAKDFPRLRAFLREEPVAFGELLALIAELVARYLQAQARAGAQVLQVFESWGGLLSREDWDVHVRPHTGALLAELAGADRPRVLFQNGAPHLARDAAELPCEGLGLCWRSDLAGLREALGPGKALQGNLDPACLLAGPEATREATERLMASLPARGHVMNLGHGLHPQTPLESIAALIEAVHAEEQAR